MQFRIVSRFGLCRRPRGLEVNIRKNPVASKSPGILIATGKPESRMRRNSKSDAASSSQARLQDAYLRGLMDTATVKPVATKEESGNVDLSEPETWSLHEEEVTVRPVASETATGKPNASSKSDQPKVPKLKEENGHTIYTCLQPQFITWKESSRSSGKSTNEDQMIQWITWTLTWLFGAYF